MVNITSKENHFVFEIMGMHKLWALTNKISVQKDNIVKVYHNDRPIPFWKGWRAPGTEIPGIIAAGTFYLKGRNFWDVMNGKNAITVELENEPYKKLIIEVRNPEEAIQLLNQK